MLVFGQVGWDGMGFFRRFDVSQITLYLKVKPTKISHKSKVEGRDDQRA